MTTLATIHQRDEGRLIPSSYHATITGSHEQQWTAAIHSEWKSMLDNDVFDPADPTTLPKTAYLYGIIDRELYIRMPEGFHDYTRVPKYYLLKLKRSI